MQTSGFCRAILRRRFSITINHLSCNCIRYNAGECSGNMQKTRDEQFSLASSLRIITVGQLVRLRLLVCIIQRVSETRERYPARQNPFACSSSLRALTLIL